MNEFSNHTVKVGPLVVDHDRRRGRVGEDDLYLSVREFDLLAKLLDEPERLVTFDELLRDTFGSAVGVTRRTVESCAERIRRKLDLLGLPNAIADCGGIGLRFLVADGGGENRDPRQATLREVA